jgi:hypothetical protein
LRSEIEKSVEALPGGALRNRMQRIPSPIRGVTGVAALGWAGYSVVTGSGVYGWLVMLPVLATLPTPLLALTTLAICLIVVSVPLALIASILPRKP